ncbi:hypothetical protein [Flaviaesturariibacter aridisoli]|uniref:Uncharacterized protein n=1 Tax=Flaviaesturariibacter aridisoli TaxID=2545761 RepID=A0A4R4E138_9BACT|nr:hypothetical protein [Flaviaesturariibacter aridisoli]TCZ73109.1 hypothetical protein E0486_07085 [Flaviaesturariibacter aridisoli]
MEPRKNIALELQEGGLQLPAGLHVPPYAVPEGYFAAFAATVLARIHREEAAAELQELAPLLAGLPKSMPFAVPEGYFAAPAVPSLLDSLDRKMPFSTPAGYFEGLPGLLLTRLRQGEAVPATSQPARVVGMRPRWVRMAAAAVLAGAIAVGGWLYESRTPAANPEAVVQAGLRTVPDGALDEFLQTADPASATDVAQSSSPHSDVRQMLHDVSVSELDAFLEGVPGEDDPLADIN